MKRNIYILVLLATVFQLEVGAQENLSQLSSKLSTPSLVIELSEQEIFSQHLSLLKASAIAMPLSEQDNLREAPSQASASSRIVDLVAQESTSPTLTLLNPSSLKMDSTAQETLNQYLKTAAENNPALKAAFNEYMAILEKVPQSGSLPDPTIAFAYFIQPIETRLGSQEAKFSFMQMFPWTGTLTAKKNSVKAKAMAKYKQVEDLKSKLFFDVKSTYYMLYFYQKAIEISNNNIEILESRKKIISAKVESGSKSLADILRTEMEINEINNRLALLKDNIIVQTTKFNKLLNTDKDADISIAPGIYHAKLLDKNKELESIISNNHALASYNYLEEELQHKHKLARKEGLPKISLGLEYAIIGKNNMDVKNNGQDAIIFPKIGFTLPIYRKKHKAKIKEVAYLQQAVAEEKTQKQNTLTVLFEEAWRDYTDAQRRVKLYTKQIELADKSISILETQYSTNRVSFEEVLNMERKRLRYELELQKAIVEKETAATYIKYLQGK